MANPTDANSPIFTRFDVGLSHTPSYQSSAKPYVVSGLVAPASGGDASVHPKETSFDYVTKFITIRNDGDKDVATAPLRLAFTSGGVGAFDPASSGSGAAAQNYVIIHESSSFSADFRVSRLYVMSDNSDTPEYTIIAGLTNIRATHLTSSWDGQRGLGGLEASGE